MQKFSVNNMKRAFVVHVGDFAQQTVSQELGTVKETALYKTSKQKKHIQPF